MDLVMISPIDQLSVVDIMGKYLSVETQGRRLSWTCQQARGKEGRAGVLELETVLSSSTFSHSVKGILLWCISLSEQGSTTNTKRIPVQYIQNTAEKILNMKKKQKYVQVLRDVLYKMYKSHSV